MTIPRRVRLLLFALGGLVLLGVLLLLLLPVFIDANTYRGTIEAKAEELLGRDVSLGEIKLSLLPLGVKVADVAVAALPEEGGGDLIAVRSLRVGARLGPLLRKRLEVTSVVLDGPSIVLERAADGTWNVQRLLAGETEPGAAPEGGGGAPPVSVDRLRVTGGQVTLRAQAPDGSSVEAQLTGLDLEIRDLALDREVEVRLSSALSGATLRLQGSAGPLLRPAGAPFHLAADLEVAGLPPERLRDLAGAFGGVAIPSDMIAGSQVNAGAAFRATFADAGDGLALQEAEVSRLSLSGVELTVARSADGRWSFEDLLGGAGEATPAAAAPAEAPEISVGGIELADLRLRVIDEAGAARRELVLGSLGLRVDGLPTRQAAQVLLETRVAVDGKDVGTLKAKGSLGPLPRDEGPVPVDLLVELAEVRLAPAGPYLRDLAGLELPGGSLDLAAKLTGKVPEEFQVSGTLDLSGVEVRVASTQGGEGTAPLDAEVFYDLAWSAGGDRLDLRTFDLSLAGAELALRGQVDISGPRTRVDLTLDPSEVMADDLARLAAAVGFELPVAMSSDRPIGIEARVRGEVGGDRLPDLSGKLTLADFSLRHPSMSAPLEEVGAVVSLQGETVEIRDLRARIGGSDLAGEITASGFEAPRVRFALRSQRADFWELMSFAGSDEATAEAAKRKPAGAEEAGLLEGVVADGTLAIAEGSFQTLDFTELDAGMKLEGQVVTLDPFRMKLYGGQFRGSATVDLGAEPQTFRVKSDVQEVDVNGLLADNLELDGMLQGKFSGNLEARGAGADFETIVRGLGGGGSVLVTDGRVAQLDVLEVLSKATGVFGEQTLQSLSGKLAAEGTPFDRLSGTVRLQGKDMRSDDLVLSSPDLVLKGEGTVDLLEATLDGDFQVIFSRALSDSMRAEKSRAAQAFWDPKIDQVNLPVTLKGPFASPTPGIDWGTAAENVVRRKAEERLKDKLGGLGGLLEGGDAGGAATSNLAGGGSSAGAASGGQAASGGPAASGGGDDLVAEISRVRWGGSFLMKDLKIEGVVRGANISHASLVVSDAEGNELKRIERLNEVENHFAGGVDRALPAAVSWDATVDGKKLVRAEAPFSIVLTVYDTAGGSREARTEARR